MINADMAHVFREIAILMEIKGADGFRVNSYRRVARTIDELADDISAVAARGELGTLEGVGKSTAEKIHTLLDTGRITLREELLAEVPESLLKLVEVPTLGPKRVGMLWHELGIQTLSDLKRTIQDDTLLAVKGFGPRSIELILRGIEFLERCAGTTRLGDAWLLSTRLRAAVRHMKGARRVVRAGALRRGCEVVDQIDLLCTAENATDAANIVRQFTRLPGVREVHAADEAYASVRVEWRPGQSLRVNLNIVPEKSLGAAWVHFTGSAAHTTRLRELAARRGCQLTEFGLFSGRRLLACQTEEDIYKELNLPWIPAELREDEGEFSLYEMPDDLLKPEAIRGDLHMHTVASDGRNTIEEMAAAAKHRGYEYICITEHSRSSTIGGGLTVEELQEHIRRVRAAAEKIPGITVWVGTEVDILADGALDYPDELLEQLDFVIASIHAGMGYNEKLNTQRTLAALRSPYVNCIGHPTGRLINEREAMPMDMEVICKEAARTRTALELNANYYRLDVKDEHARLARELGATMVINTDAHSAAQFEQIHFGILTGRRAMLREHDVLNTRSADEIARFVTTKRKIRFVQK